MVAARLAGGTGCYLTVNSEITWRRNWTHQDRKVLRGGQPACKEMEQGASYGEHNGEDAAESEA